MLAIIPCNLQCIWSQLTNHSGRCFLKWIIGTFPLPTLCLAVGEQLMLWLAKKRKVTQKKRQQNHCLIDKLLYVGINVVTLIYDRLEPFPGRRQVCHTQTHTHTHTHRLSSWSRVIGLSGRISKCAKNSLKPVSTTSSSKHHDWTTLILDSLSWN